MGTLREIPIQAVSWEPPKRKTTAMVESSSKPRKSLIFVSAHHRNSLLIGTVLCRVSSSRIFVTHMLSWKDHQSHTPSSNLLLLSCRLLSTQLADAVISKDGILAFCEDHGLPQDNLRIVKEDDVENIENLANDLDSN
ncbi:hypothetical protein OSTOST_19601 [Ostertagia ostertagi]